MSIRRGGEANLINHKHSYGTPLPGVEQEEYSGKLIVIEGTDGVGRSTHIGMLRTWLESRGHAVLDTGMTRSILAGRGIKEAKKGHTLGRLTMQLFYATDFIDRLENEMLPALRAGFVVLTDRYIYSAIARAEVRGIDSAWIRSIYSMAFVPNAIFYLRISSPQHLVERVVSSGRGFDYWESGMDLHLGEDLYDSFIEYQTRMLKVFDRLTGEYRCLGGPVRIVERLRRNLEDEFHAVMADLTPNLPRFELAAAAMVVTPDQLKAVEAAQRRSKKLAGSGAAAGGLLGGGGAFAAAGALLGPLGLLGGALVGYKLSQLVGSARSLERARDAIKERLDEISVELIKDFDRQVAEAIEALRHAVMRRRKMFAADLYQQFDLVQSLGADPAMLATHRRDAERFADAFAACADRAAADRVEHQSHLDAGLAALAQRPGVVLGDLAVGQDVRDQVDVIARLGDRRELRRPLGHGLRSPGGRGRRRAPAA